MKLSPSFCLKRIIRFPERIIFFYGMVCLSLQLSGQSYYFDNYGVQEGLSSSKVYCIIQDHRDYIWLGTESGLSRFNGLEFENFSSEHGLAENGVFSLLEDTRGNIWLGHLDGGVSIFDGKGFTIVEFDTIELKGDITSITEVDEEVFWITTSAAGAVRISNTFGDPDERKVEHYTGKEGLSDIVYGTAVQNMG